MFSSFFRKFVLIFRGTVTVETTENQRKTFRDGLRRTTQNTKGNIVETCAARVLLGFCWGSALVLVRFC